MAKVAPTSGGAVGDRWRRLRRGWPGPWVWAYWGLTVWCGLALVHFAPRLDALVFPLAVVASAAMAAMASLFFGLLAAPLLARMGSVVAVPPPPAVADPDEAYVVSPRPSYPAVQLLRGQCGWVLLRSRLDARGRVRAYRIVEQAPRRVFERSVVQALLKAQLPPGGSREASSLVTFVAPGPSSPDWAIARLSGPN